MSSGSGGCFAELRQRGGDEWSVVLQFLDAQDWMRMVPPPPPDGVYRAKRILTDKELAWFGARPVKLLETSNEDANGTQCWYKNGEAHRDDDRPAVIEADGSQAWYQNGQLHRDGDRPAFVGADGRYQAWYQNGRRHRDGDQPAEIGGTGMRAWYQNGRRHRDGDLPAYIGADGTQEWYLNGVLQWWRKKKR